MAAVENGKKPEVGWKPLMPPKAKLLGFLSVLLRVGALLATLAAALVMGFNRQTRSMGVAIVGTTPIYQTLTAKFQHTPAFVYFVIANAIASVYNLLVLLLRHFARCKKFGLLVHLTDMVVLALVATGAAGAASMAELGKNGNVHARWFPLCDKFDAFCRRNGGAIIVSFIGTALLLILNAFSTITVYKKFVNDDD